MKSLVIIASGLLLACLLGAQTPAATPLDLPAGVAGAVRQLRDAVAASDLEAWHVGRKERRILAEARRSLALNLDDAVPNLLAVWKRQPENLGAAFRLYRDLSAVEQVAASTAESAQRDGGGEDATALGASTQALKQELHRLADFIQATGTLQYAQLHAAATTPAPSARPTRLVIQNANGRRARRRRRHHAVKKRVAPPR